MFFVRCRYDKEMERRTDPPVWVLWVQVYMVEAAISAADSTAVPSVGSSRTSTALVGVVLITPVIIIHVALGRRLSLDHAKAMAVSSHHATAAYVILGIITRLYSYGVILGESPQVLPIYSLHDHRSFSPFFTCALTCAFHVTLSSKITPRYF